MTTPLVGSVAWMCIPRFDSLQIFGRLLDGKGRMFRRQRERLPSFMRSVHDRIHSAGFCVRHGVAVAHVKVMRNRHEVRAFDRIPSAYDDVRDAWLADPLGILQRATTTGLSGLFGAKLRAPLGPLEIASEIVVDIVAIEPHRSPNGGPATKLVIEWGAMRRPELFPTMRATISIYPCAPTETVLQFCGTYQPPLGPVGEAVDAMAMHHIAKVSVACFLRDIARFLSRRVSEGTVPHEEIPMNVSSLIRRDVTSCTIHNTLERAAQLMWEHDIGCLPVIDDQGHVAGMITDRDICMAAYTQGAPLRAIPITSAMARRVFSCRETDEVDAVEKVMSERQIRRMPVIDDQGHPLGIISLDDIARAASTGMVPARDVVATLAAVSEPR